MDEIQRLQKEIEADRKLMAEGKMTREEIEKKIAYHERKAESFFAHAAELEKYIAARQGKN